MFSRTIEVFSKLITVFPKFFCLIKMARLNHPTVVMVEEFVMVENAILVFGLLFKSFFRHKGAVVSQQGA